MKHDIPLISGKWATVETPVWEQINPFSTLARCVGWGRLTICDMVLLDCPQQADEYLPHHDFKELMDKLDDLCSRLNEQEQTERAELRRYLASLL